MTIKQIIYLAGFFIFISCKGKNTNQELNTKEVIKQDSLITNHIPLPDTLLATWASHSIHSFQLLELKDSSNAIVYEFIDGHTSLDRNKIETPYYFKAKGKVTHWDKNQLSVRTDKYNYYYNIWKDTLILWDEAGIQEKLIRVYNDTVMRNQF